MVNQLIPGLWLPDPTMVPDIAGDDAPDLDQPEAPGPLPEERRMARHTRSRKVFVADGTVDTYVFDFGFVPECVYLQNASLVSFTLTFSEGSSLQLLPGAQGIYLLWGDRWLRAVSAAAASGVLLVEFYRDYPERHLGGFNPLSAISVVGQVNQAAHGATATVSVSGANTVLATAAATRLGLLLFNTDAVNSIRYNFDGSSTGALLPAGSSVPLGAFTGEVWGSPVAGTPAVDVTQVLI